MKNPVNERLATILTMLQKKIETYLALCKTPEQEMFLLSYFQSIIDGNTARWFSYSLEEKTGPYFEYEDDEHGAKYFPSGLRWHETNNTKIRSVVNPLEYELHPQYPINDEFGGFAFTIDFAFFYPRTDGQGEKIKVAIECGRNNRQKQSKTFKTQAERDRYLQSIGWLVARFTGSEVYQKDIYDLLEEVDKIAMNKDYELFQETEKHRIKWKFN